MIARGPGRRRSGGALRLLLTLFAWLMIVVGLIITPTPIPVGLLMVGVGLALLLGNSLGARAALRRLRQRHPRFSLHLTRLERHVGRGPAVLLRRTDPHRQRHRSG